MKPFFVVLLIAALTGCTHNSHRTAEATAYVNAQKELAIARKPLFELRAQPGQTITLSGVEALVINDPREQRIEALPQQRNEFFPTVLGLAKLGVQVYAGEQQKDMWLGITQSIGANAGDHSTTMITDSYNTRGDEISDSNLISGGVTGDGAGIGNAFDDADTTLSGNGSALGNQNVVDNQAVGRDRIEGDRNQNSGRQESDGPYDNDVDCQAGSGGNGGSSGTTGASGSGATGGTTNCSGGG
jgi:hypothetical protein